MCQRHESARTHHNVFKGGRVAAGKRTSATKRIGVSSSFFRVELERERHCALTSPCSSTGEHGGQPKASERTHTPRRAERGTSWCQRNAHHTTALCARSAAPRLPSRRGGRWGACHAFDLCAPDSDSIEARRDAAFRPRCEPISAFPRRSSLDKGRRSLWIGNSFPMDREVVPYGKIREVETSPTT